MSEPVLTSNYCTNWGAYNTPRMWAMVAAEDDPEAWRQVAAWADVAESVREHRARLQLARDALAGAWPPSQNTSADAFIKEFDKLLTKMDQAKADADSTATGLANILEELRQAKNDLKPLYEEYKEKNNDIIPGWVDHKEDDIDDRARQRMVAAESVVAQHIPQIKVPEQYRMDPNARSGWEGGDTGRTAGSSGTSGSGFSGGSSGGGGASFAVPHDPPPTLPGEDPILPDDLSTGGGSVGGGGVGDPGLGLAGVAPPMPPPVPPGNPGLPGVPPIIGNPPGPPAPPIAPILPGLPGGGGGSLPGVHGGGGTGRGPIGRAGVRPGGMRGALPSGAVIGETVGGTGRGPAGGRGTAGTTGGRGTAGTTGGRGTAGTTGGRGTAGGIGGGTAGGRGPKASAKSAAGKAGAVKPQRPSWLPPDEPAAGRSGGTAASGAGRRGAGDEEHEGTRFDPDNPWEVESGVSPVIRPRPQTDRHDPGPNVIGGFRG